MIGAAPNKASLFAIQGNRLTVRALLPSETAQPDRYQTANGFAVFLHRKSAAIWQARSPRGDICGQVDIHNRQRVAIESKSKHFKAASDLPPDRRHLRG